MTCGAGMVRVSVLHRPLWAWAIVGLFTWVPVVLCCAGVFGAVFGAVHSGEVEALGVALGLAAFATGYALLACRLWLPSTIADGSGIIDWRWGFLRRRWASDVIDALRVARYEADDGSWVAYHVQVRAEGRWEPLAVWFGTEDEASQIMGRIGGFQPNLDFHPAAQYTSNFGLRYRESLPA